MSRKVQHLVSSKQFVIELENGCRALLDYSLLPGNVMDMTHTETPPQCQGQGVAANLAKAAFEYAVANDYKVRPTCTYIQHYVEKNPDYLKLVSNS